MSTEALVWAMDQETGYPSAKLALIMMAEQSCGGGDQDLWVGTEVRLAHCCDMSELDMSHAMWILAELGLIQRMGMLRDKQVWRLNVGGQPDLEAFLGWPTPRRTTPSPGGGHAAKVSNSRRRRVYERDAYRCVHCGGTEDLTIDHKHPRIRGGTNAEDNLQTLCRSCNSSKGARV